MQDSDYLAIMTALGAFYPNFQLKEETLIAYRSVLDDLPSEILRAAALQIGATSKWFPAASELRATAWELIEREHGVPSAPDAWAEVTDAMWRIGIYHQPKFSHDLVQRAVDAIGGWTNLCMSEQATADRARFFESYSILLDRARTDARMLPAVRKVMSELAAKMSGRLLTRGAGR